MELSLHSDEREVLLGRALRPLKQILSASEFGLVPTRVLVFMTNEFVGTDGQQTQYPTREMRVRIMHQEIGGDLKLAVTSFLEMLLDSEAPPNTLSSFLQALYDANSEPGANEEAWFLHDIIILVCVYMPFQQALLEFINQGQSQGQEEDTIDLERVMVQMHQNRLLKPEFIPLVLESRELEGIEAATVNLLACVYATRVDALKAEYTLLQEDVQPMLQEPLLWLRYLITCLENNGGHGFSQTLPHYVLSPETWATAYDQLAYGRLGRMRFTDEGAQLKNRNKASLTNVYQLLCRKCQSEVCMSTDFRMLEQCNRAVVAPELSQRWKRVERGGVSQYKFNVEKIAKVHCKKCSFDWGVLVRYIPTGKELPVLKIESFFVKDVETGVMVSRKIKWSQAPFHVEAISEEELSGCAE